MNYTQADVKLAEAYELLAEIVTCLMMSPQDTQTDLEDMIADSQAIRPKVSGWLRDYEERFDTVSVAVAKNRCPEEVDPEEVARHFGDEYHED